MGRGVSAPVRAEGRAVAPPPAIVPKRSQVMRKYVGMVLAMAVFVAAFATLAHAQSA